MSFNGAALAYTVSRRVGLLLEVAKKSGRAVLLEPI